MSRTFQESEKESLEKVVSLHCLCVWESKELGWKKYGSHDAAAKEIKLMKDNIYSLMKREMMQNHVS